MRAGILTEEIDTRLSGWKPSQQFPRSENKRGGRSGAIVAFRWLSRIILTLQSPFDTPEPYGLFDGAQRLRRGDASNFEPLQSASRRASLAPSTMLRAFGSRPFVRDSIRNESKVGGD
jgi:hypothetical protein